MPNLYIIKITRHCPLRP